jgi:hypothetical protein
MTAADIEDGRDGTFSLLLRQLTVGDSDPFQASGCSLRSSSERRPSSPLAASGAAAVTAMVIVEVYTLLIVALMIVHGPLAVSVAMTLCASSVQKRISVCCICANT